MVCVFECPPRDSKPFPKAREYRERPKSSLMWTTPCRVEWRLRLRPNFAERTGKNPAAACDVAHTDGGRGRKKEGMGMRY